MNEMAMLANLLNNPEQAEFLDIRKEWFTNRSLGEIACAVKRVGRFEHVVEVYEDLLENKVSGISLEDLEMIANDPQKDSASFDLMSRLLHKEWLDKQIKKAMAEFQVDARNKHLAKVKALIQERDEIQSEDCSGNLAEQADDFKELLYSEQKTTIETFPSLAKRIGGGFRGGQLVTIGARSGVGKTLVSLSFLNDFVNRDRGVRADFFSLEMTTFEIMNRIISNRASINSLLLVDYTNLSPENKDKAMQTYQDFATNYDVGIYDQRLQTLGAIKRKIKQRRQETNGKYVAFIDYAGLINVEGVSNGGDSSGRIKMNIITRELKLLATELDCPIFLLAQLNRGLEYRQDKTPTLADLKESGSLEQDSSMVFFISKDNDDKNHAYLDIAKNRIGMTDRLDFYMNPAYMEFREYDAE